MAKFKVGDVVKPVSMWDMGYHPNLIPDSEYKVLDEDDGTLTVEGKFNNLESGKGWSEDWFELVESKTTVESLRNSILDIRSKREELQKEILQLDAQEKEAVEKLKEQGFVLYEQNVAQTLTGQAVVATENKAVLYAEDIEEGMTNPENWEVGDMLEVCTGQYSGLWYVGDLVEIANVYDHGVALEVITKGSKGDVEDLNAWNIYEIKEGKIKFHSRPVK